MAMVEPLKPSSPREAGSEGRSRYESTVGGVTDSASAAVGARLPKATLRGNKRIGKVG